MANFRDPAMVIQDFFVLVKFWHAVDGVFIWEFFTTLDYEWSVIRGHRPYRWTILMYSLTRWAGLVAVILNLVGLNVTKPINCQAWITFELIFSNLSFTAASLLIVLRIVAIWNKNKIAVATATGAWITNIALLIQGTAVLRSTWDPARNVCVVFNTATGKLSTIVTLVTDIVLLLIMLVGLLRLRRYGSGMFRLAQLMWKQGVIWLFVATITEVTPVVFISLNLNDPFNIMFKFPSLITMAIVAPRMHRALVDFASESTDIIQDSLPTTARSRSIVFRSNHTHHTPVRLPPMEVAMHTTCELYAEAHRASCRSCDGSGSDIGLDGQPRDKPQERSLGDDMESGM
ncbi:hypothetical protein BJV74DRAFT_73961 [Russula compacta]|nr:hypothetical protein BJV74DRAFT_73961 [Russula compacta]